MAHITVHTGNDIPELSSLNNNGIYSTDMKQIVGSLPELKELSDMKKEYEKSMKDI